MVRAGKVSEIEHHGGGSTSQADFMHPLPEVLVAFGENAATSSHPCGFETLDGTQNGFLLHIEGKHESLGADESSKEKRVMAIAGRCVDDEVPRTDHLANIIMGKRERISNDRDDRDVWFVRLGMFHGIPFFRLSL
jgi:hypothetical protein